MIRTNTKIYQDRIEQYIIDSIDLEFTDKGHYTRSQKRHIQIQYVWTCFDSEFNFLNNKIRYPNHQDRVANWLQGLPSSINIDFE